MFEHLGPIKNKRKISPAKSYKIHLSFLLLATLIFAMSFIGRGVSRTEARDTGFNATIQAIALPRVFAADIPRVSLFDFSILADKQTAELTYLKMAINGVFDQDLINNLYLQHEGVQIGQVKTIDQDGNIYFQIEGLKLHDGTNNFSIQLNNQNILRPNDIVEFSFPDANSVFLSNDGHLASPNQVYPISGGAISFVDHGTIFAKNNNPSEQLALATEKNILADFDLLAEAESVDVRALTLSVANKSAATLPAEFELYSDEQLVASSIATKNKIIFDLDKHLALSLGQNINFKIKANGSAATVLSLQLEEVQATGFASGQEIALDNHIDLGSVKLLDYYPVFTVASQNTKNSNGWNNLYSFQAIPKGTAIELEKISFKVESVNAKIEELQLWIDDKPSITNGSISSEGKVVFVWPEKFKLDHPSNILLVGKIKETDTNWSVQARILPDNGIYDSFENSNIVWSVQGTRSNSYLLPSFPLEPVIMQSYKSID